MATYTDAEGKQARLPAGHGGRHARAPASWPLNQAPLQSTWDGSSYGGGLLVLKHGDTGTQTTSQGQRCTPNCLPEGFGHTQGHPSTASELLCESNFSSPKYLLLAHPCLAPPFISAQSSPITHRDCEAHPPTCHIPLVMATCAFSTSLSPSLPVPAVLSLCTRWEIWQLAPVPGAEGCHPRWPQRHRRRCLPAIPNAEIR